MTVQELIEKLQEIEDRNQHIFVWQGYKKTSITTEFSINQIKRDQANTPFILLEGE